jgi:holo-[acyl-carrier protein] synthase
MVAIQTRTERVTALVSGIGFDLIDLSDFARTLERSGERFIQRIYTKEEIEYCRAQPHPVQSFAVRFAAKEAAMKAMGIAGQDGLSWRDFEVVCESGGRPKMTLHGRAAKGFSALQLRSLHISLSHSQSGAGAVVIAENAGPRGRTIRQTAPSKRSARMK